MMAGSAEVATPFGYQTDVIVYQLRGYRYMDFVRVGLPLNLIPFVVAILAIRVFFPFWITRRAFGASRLVAVSS